MVIFILIDSSLQSIESGGRLSHNTNMDLIYLYAIGVGATAVVLTILRIASTLIQYLRRMYSSAIRKHLVYPLVTTRQRGTTNISIVQAACIMLYATANVIFLILGVSSWPSLSHRASLLFVVNLVPLFIGGRTNVLGDKLLRLEKYQLDLAHRWIGRVCAVQGGLHGIVVLVKGSSTGKPMGLPVSRNLIVIVDC